MLAARGLRQRRAGVEGFSSCRWRRAPPGVLHAAWASPLQHYAYSKSSAPTTSTSPNLGSVLDAHGSRNVAALARSLAKALRHGVGRLADLAALESHLAAAAADTQSLTGGSSTPELFGALLQLHEVARREWGLALPGVQATAVAVAAPDAAGAAALAGDTYARLDTRAAIWTLGAAANALGASPAAGVVLDGLMRSLHATTRRGGGLGLPQAVAVQAGLNSWAVVGCPSAADAAVGWLRGVLACHPSLQGASRSSSKALALSPGLARGVVQVLRGLAAAVPSATAEALAALPPELLATAASKGGDGTFWGDDVAAAPVGSRSVHRKDAWDGRPLFSGGSDNPAADVNAAAVVAAPCASSSSTVEAAVGAALVYACTLLGSPPPEAGYTRPATLSVLDWAWPAKCRGVEVDGASHFSGVPLLALAQAFPEAVAGHNQRCSEEEGGGRSVHVSRFRKTLGAYYQHVMASHTLEPETLTQLLAPQPPPPGSSAAAFATKLGLTRVPATRLRDAVSAAAGDGWNTSIVTLPVPLWVGLGGPVTPSSLRTGGGGGVSAYLATRPALKALVLAAAGL